MRPIAIIDNNSRSSQHPLIVMSHSHSHQTDSKAVSDSIAPDCMLLASEMRVALKVRDSSRSCRSTPFTSLIRSSRLLPSSAYHPRISTSSSSKPGPSTSSMRSTCTGTPCTSDRPSNDSRSATNVPITIKQKKQVRFNSRTQGKYIENARSLSEEEISIRWRTAHEERANEMEMVKTVKIMAKNAGTLPARYRPDDDMTSRGLEHMATRDIIRNRSQTKQKHVDAVLDECYEQSVSRDHDPAAIAIVSKLHSSKAVVAAQIRARADADDAAIYYYYVAGTTAGRGNV